MSNEAVADSHALIASLYLEDIDRVQASRKGKAQDGSPLTDEELAFQLYAEEMSRFLAVSRDAILAGSIDKAIEEDRTLLRAYATFEAQEARDRNMAFSLSGQTRPSAPASSTFTDADDVVSLVDAVEGITLDVPDSTPYSRFTSTTAQASSSRFRLPPRFAPKPAQDCVICQDPIRGPEVRAPCGHYYDVSCLGDLFRTATIDESLYPPRCCQQSFVLRDVRRYLGDTVARAFEKKALEFGTANRVYCHRPACSAFLGAATSTPRSYLCLSCYIRTCGQCKQADHAPHPCDTAQDREVLNLAEQEGWKRCPGCSHLVELAYGCYHMTCRCRKQFCYLCAADWKTCGCPQWEEQRLLDAAAVRVERRLPRGAVPPPAPAYQTMIREMAERLREDHDCQHSNWRYRSGGGRCENCDFVLPRYLLQCRGCQMLACVRCQRNRL
ncbi:hypothetical protein PHLGIDRAFT_477035 [Phlebiopsis gigantea 11061_1 CR5-6]|uniref:RBR-type E3 ubiquitin transferase n=1 Tax=Phlebiopsis gigantea (strain 11061_1 CR5-6) TaxID=745531 RepID=A0A0C3P134_PHLG1|nr:hypothetical protein PHLGIDRAFT_477035 [Phlebiopsis gigantea 11061_1 CR5-6]